MPYDVKRFIFSVSLCAMLAANPVLATTPTNDEGLGTTHDVYVESTLNQATNGIAGVSYVNRMVNAAGNAAELAEGHAAAAGAHALSAAQSADEAHKVLADKVNIDQGADNKNKVMVTDSSGFIKPAETISFENISAIDHSGYPITGFFYGNENGDVGLFAVPGGAPALVGWNDGAPIAITAPTMSSGGVLALFGTGVDTSFVVRKIEGSDIEERAVSIKNIAGFGADRLGTYSGVIAMNGDGAIWRRVGNDDIGDGAVTSSKIYDGAVTIDKTAGVVGMVPVGSADATTYGQFWIE